MTEAERDEITRLREELAAVTERMPRLDFERTAAELERDTLRKENELLMQAWNEEKGFLNKYIDKIEYLREENARLRELLKAFVPKTQWIDPAIPDTRPIDVMVRAGELRAAAAAILGKVKDEAACPEPDAAP